MTRNAKVATGAGAAIVVVALLLLLSGEASTADLPSVDEDECPPGTKRKIRNGPCEPEEPTPDEPVPGMPDKPTDIPPPPECDEGLVPVWHGWRANRTTMQWVADWRCEPGPAKPECPPGKHLVWQRRRGEWVCVDDPTIGDIDDVIKDFPEGASFYQVRQGDKFFGTRFKLSGKRDFSIVYGLVRRECFLAAKEFGGMDDAQAMAWAAQVAERNAVRIQVLNVILCGEFSDTAYGTWGYCGDRAINSGKCPASMRNHPGPHGRAIRLLPQHADNLGRMRSGQAAARVVTIGSSATAGDASSKTVAGAPGGHLPALWMPGFNREVIWTSGGNTWTTEGMRHADGSSTLNPPAWLWDRGVADFTNLPDGIDFGCEG